MPAGKRTSFWKSWPGCRVKLAFESPHTSLSLRSIEAFGLMPQLLEKPRPEAEQGCRQAGAARGFEGQLCSKKLPSFALGTDNGGLRRPPQAGGTRRPTCWRPIANSQAQQTSNSSKPLAPVFRPFTRPKTPLTHLKAPRVLPRQALWNARHSCLPAP